MMAYIGEALSSALLGLPYLSVSSAIFPKVFLSLKMTSYCILNVSDKKRNYLENCDSKLRIQTNGLVGATLKVYWGRHNFRNYDVIL